MSYIKRARIVAYSYEIYVNDYKVDVIHVEPFLLVEGSMSMLSLEVM